MKTRNYFGLIALTVFSLSSFASGQTGYAPNFDSFDGDSTLSGQDGWDTNDANQPDYVGEIPSYSTSTSDYWAALGGLVRQAPASPTTYLFRNFSLGDGGNATFSVKMAVTSSTSPRVNDDSFGWAFRQSDGTDIVSIDFVYNSPTVLQIRWTDYNGSQTSTSFGLAYNAQYDLTANLLNLGGTPTLTVVADPVGADPAQTVINTALNVATPSGISQVAAYWTLSNLTQSGGNYTEYGSNGMVFQDYVVAVPEPSTIALGVLAFGGLLAYRRFRKTV